MERSLSWCQRARRFVIRYIPCIAVRISLVPMLKSSVLNGGMVISGLGKCMLIFPVVSSH